jgi:hypothetical protein
MSRSGEPHETFTVGPNTVNIYHDTYADSPDEWGDEERFISAWHEYLNVKRKNWDSFEDFAEFAHPKHRESIIDLIESGRLLDFAEPKSSPANGPEDPIWRSDYLSGCSDAMETLLHAAGEEIEWENPDGIRRAEARYEPRADLQEAWNDYRAAHEKWAVFKLDISYYGGGNLRVHLGYLYDGDYSDSHGRQREPKGFVVIKREAGVDVELAARGLVETWEQYLDGDVWYYEILDANEETLESCGGYYGLAECIAEARSTAEHFSKK